MNQDGFGEYPDGFSPANEPDFDGVSVPGCYAEDDFSRALGDPSEAMLAAALQYREDETCPAVPTITKTSLGISSQKAASDAPAIEIGGSPALRNALLRP